jgi:hypothetical protein
MPPTAATCALLDRVMDALDYRALADLYCEEGGAAFWEDRRPAVVELGLAWAAELAPRLAAGGRSLYVGAGVAELPALLMEACDLRRACDAVNLRARECEVIEAALRAHGAAERVRFTAGDAAEARGSGYDHLSAVSVLSDPETFPWLSGFGYGRIAPVDLDVEAFARERTRAQQLVAHLFAALAPRALVTTTDEEEAWWLHRAAQLGVPVQNDATELETALVGDRLCFLRIGAGG